MNIKNYIQNKKSLIRYCITTKLNLLLKKTVINPEEIVSLNFKKIMIYAPHCDDEIIGCGGLLLKLKKQNPDSKIYIYFLNSTDEIRKKEAEEVASKLGLELIYDWKSIVTDCDLILLPSLIENHSAHYSLFIKITNYLLHQKINTEIFLYNVWSVLFPNIVIDISEEIQNKLDLLNIYQSQLQNKNYIHIVKGLNAYYSIYLPRPHPTPAYAEVYYKTNINEIPSLLNV